MIILRDTRLYAAVVRIRLVKNTENTFLTGLLPRSNQPRNSQNNRQRQPAQSIEKEKEDY
jgi:hypothetical protein